MSRQRRTSLDWLMSRTSVIDAKTPREMPVVHSSIRMIAHAVLLACCEYLATRRRFGGPFIHGAKRGNYVAFSKEVRQVRFAVRAIGRKEHGTGKQKRSRTAAF